MAAINDDDEISRKVERAKVQRPRGGLRSAEDSAEIPQGSALCSSRIPMRRGEWRWAQTLVQKILRRHVVDGGSAEVGEFVALRPRHVLTHDNSFAVIRKFRELGAARVHHRSNLRR